MKYEKKRITLSITI